MCMDVQAVSTSRGLVNVRDEVDPCEAEVLAGMTDLERQASFPTVCCCCCCCPPGGHCQGLLSGGAVVQRPSCERGSGVGVQVLGLRVVRLMKVAMRLLHAAVGGRSLLPRRAKHAL